MSFPLYFISILCPPIFPYFCPHFSPFFLFPPLCPFLFCVLLCLLCSLFTYSLKSLLFSSPVPCTLPSLFCVLSSFPFFSSTSLVMIFLLAFLVFYICSLRVCFLPCFSSSLSTSHSAPIHSLYFSFCTLRHSLFPSLLVFPPFSFLFCVVFIPCLFSPFQLLSTLFLFCSFLYCVFSVLSFHSLCSIVRAAQWRSF